MIKIEDCIRQEKVFKDKKSNKKRIIYFFNCKNECGNEINMVKARFNKASSYCKSCWHQKVQTKPKNESGFKVCSLCKENLLISNFFLSKKSNNNHTNRCYKCTNLKNIQLHPLNMT